MGEPPAAFAAGTTFGQRVKVMGMPADVRWTVAELQEPTRVTLTGQGPMGIGLRTDYAVADGGDGASRITVAMDFSGPAVMAMGSQISQEVGGQMRSSLEKLKGLCEG